MADMVDSGIHAFTWWAKVGTQSGDWWSKWLGPFDHEMKAGVANRRLDHVTKITIKGQLEFMRGWNKAKKEYSLRKGGPVMQFKTWTDEREANAELATELGFDEVPHKGMGATYKRGDTHIWPIWNGWQVADIVDGMFKNHRPKKSLMEALEGERK